jgi:Sec-independent protein translocase protein TatA
MLDFIKNVSPTELTIVGLILVMLFGSRIVVNMAKSAGETMKELRKIKTTMGESLEEITKKTDTEVSNNA